MDGGYDTAVIRPLTRQNAAAGLRSKALFLAYWRPSWVWGAGKGKAVEWQLLPVVRLLVESRWRQRRWQVLPRDRRWVPELQRPQARVIQANAQVTSSAES